MMFGFRLLLWVFIIKFLSGVRFIDVFIGWLWVIVEVEVLLFRCSII